MTPPTKIDCSQCDNEANKNWLLPVFHKVSECLFDFSCQILLSVAGLSTLLSSYARCFQAIHSAQWRNSIVSDQAIHAVMSACWSMLRQSIDTDIGTRWSALRSLIRATSNYRHRYSTPGDPRSVVRSAPRRTIDTVIASRWSALRWLIRATSNYRHRYRLPVIRAPSIYPCYLELSTPLSTPGDRVELRLLIFEKGRNIRVTSVALQNDDDDDVGSLKGRCVNERALRRWKGAAFAVTLLTPALLWRQLNIRNVLVSYQCVASLL